MIDPINNGKFNVEKTKPKHMSVKSIMYVSKNILK